MSGTPTASEIQTQWKNSLIVLDRLRKVADSEYVGASGYFDDLLQTVEGEFTAVSLPASMARFRAGLSSMISQERAREILDPILREYARLLTWPETNPAEIAVRLRRYFVEQSASVASRGITFASTGTAGGSNVGNGVLLRLTTDNLGAGIEFATAPDVKEFRCIQDGGNGAKTHSERFEIKSKTRSFDSLDWNNAGSGLSGVTIDALHCGSGGANASILQNASFSTYSATATPKFAGWTEDAGGASVSQDTTNYYRSFPGATTDAALRMTATGGGAITLRQPLSAMRVQRLDPNVPMVLSVMVNKTIGSAATGTFTIRLGGVEVDTAIASIGSNWQRITIPLTEDCWYEEFDNGAIDVELEWSSSGSGYLLVDDVILAPWTYVDGTWFALFGGTTPFLMRDVFTVTDTGGVSGTGIINYWLWRAGYETLPTSGSPTLTDPTVP